MRARAGGVEDGLGVGGLDGGGGDVGNVVREEAAGGRAALAVSRVVEAITTHNPRLESSQVKSHNTRTSAHLKSSPN